MPPGAKKVLARSIEIGEPLGHGGMATVHRGRRLADGETVAVKVLHEHYALDKEFLTRFQREARAAAALAHPNIVAVIDSGQDGKIPFIVMEFVDGEDLRSLLQREGPLPAERAAEIAAQVCRALAYAHEHGVIHRDIKPQNILLTHSGEVKVADFGVARAVSAATITQPGTVLGSVPYLSPEQASGQPATKAADLYALGVVLYQMVTDRLPFEGETSVATAIMHIQEMPPPPRSLNPGIPPRLEGIILRALAKRPGERYPSADVMRRDLAGESDFWRESPTIALRPEDRLPPPAAGGPATSTPASGRTTRRPIGVPAAALLMFAIFGLMLSGWLDLGPLSLSAAVPDLRGKTVEAAMAVVSQRRLRMTVGNRQFSDRHAANIVMDQRPTPGERLFRHGTISVVLSRGPETVLVPDLRGRRLDEARALLEQARLKIGRVTAVYADARPGAIISQTPSRGVRLPPGSTVNLVISKGLPPLPQVETDDDDEEDDHRGRGRRRDSD